MNKSSINNNAVPKGVVGIYLNTITISNALASLIKFQLEALVLSFLAIYSSSNCVFLDTICGTQKVILQSTYKCKSSLY